VNINDVLDGHVGLDLTCIQCKPWDRAIRLWRRNSPGGILI
jgi:hypothetical protein